MLETLGLPPMRQDGINFLPSVFSPLMTAAERGDPLEPAVAAIVKLLGFDSFMYGATQSARPSHEQKTYVFTTLSREWVMRYDQQAYIEVDPRIQHVYVSAMPLVWDQQSERGKSSAVDAFLDDAAAHGVASGVAMAIYSATKGHVGVAFNSTKPEIDEFRRFEMTRNMGDMFMLGVYFHELFMKTVIQRGVPPVSQGLPLTAQERRCLLLVAHGHISRNIASSLGIGERTVELHLASARSKLGAANRQEAVATALAEGIIQWGELPSYFERLEERRRRYRVLGRMGRRDL